MKSKILTLIIGILIGAIVATGGFLIYEKTKTSSNSNNMEQNDKMEMTGDNRTR